MSATSITQSIKTLQNNILQFVHHRALLLNVGQPTLQQEQLFFIQLPFLNGEEMTADHVISASTVGIVHASLLEHEKIKEHDATSKQQQLTVLSGDYYSGRYYQLLAQTGNIELIQMLSKGIVSRCEQQIIIYEKQQRTLQQGIESITTIECELINQYYKVYGYSYLSDLMKNTLTFIRLKKEYAFIKEGEVCFLSKVLSLHNDQNAIVSTQNELHQILVKRQQQLLEMLEQIALSEELKKFIKKYITL